jgi:hypothetical protein
MFPDVSHPYWWMLTCEVLDVHHIYLDSSGRDE